MVDLFEAVFAAFRKSLVPDLPDNHWGPTGVRFASHQNTSDAPRLWHYDRKRFRNRYTPMKKPDAAENHVRLFEGARAEAVLGIDCGEALGELEVLVRVRPEGETWHVEALGLVARLPPEPGERDAQMATFADAVTDRLLAGIGRPW